MKPNFQKTLPRIPKGSGVTVYTSGVTNSPNLHELPKALRSHRAKIMAAYKKIQSRKVSFLL
jgi:hypothetical protein